ncbi:hypothetical protein [Mammaliicoccus vitulinus]|uniref:hypothetical protein n=1 Tax=Mammaliicoccus vitulinus TaxID=71237 RepID=UPI0028D75605|nr:hypothetical protein [Mammaliicoccus vitulinus]
MAYEYEEDNIRKVRLYNIMTGSSKKIKPINELKEAYAKAKAFDGIRSVDEGFYKEYGYYPNEKEWWYEASSIVEKYNEDTEEK